MSFEYVKAPILAMVVAGLCACAQVNTTATAPPGTPAPVARPLPSATPTAPARNMQQDVPAPAQPIPIPAPIVTAAPTPAQRIGPARIALLLPLRSDTLGQVASVVRAGFLAGYEREREPGWSITIVETSDTVSDVLTGYDMAARDHDIVVGPLTRSGVTAIVQSGKVSKLTIALGQPDLPGDGDILLPSSMLAIGLSIEDEARQVADWMHSDRPAAKALAISTATAWQRRAARAFAAQWQRQGAPMAMAELEITAGFFTPSSLLQLRKRIEAEKPEFLFVALDAAQTRQLRVAIGTDTPMVGTSQLNPYALADRAIAERLPDMDGVQLVDIPWQLQPDHPAVMVYPKLVVSSDQRRSADLERLYALGIDAYRVAREIAFNRTRFDLDGVTGKLKVDLDSSMRRFERAEVRAVYQDGIAVPLPAP